MLFTQNMFEKSVFCLELSEIDILCIADACMKGYLRKYCFENFVITFIFKQSLWKKLAHRSRSVCTRWRTRAEIKTRKSKLGVYFSRKTCFKKPVFNSLKIAQIQSTIVSAKVMPSIFLNNMRVEWSKLRRLPPKGCA